MKAANLIIIASFLMLGLTAGAQDCKPFQYGGDIVANGDDYVADLLTKVSNDTKYKKTWDLLTESSKSCSFQAKNKYVVRESNADNGGLTALEVYLNCTDNFDTDEAEEASFYFKFDLVNPANSCGDLIAG